jgi:hypothetical protein
MNENEKQIDISKITFQSYPLLKNLSELPKLSKESNLPTEEMVEKLRAENRLLKNELIQILKLEIMEGENEEFDKAKIFIKERMDEYKKFFEEVNELFKWLHDMSYSEYQKQKK